MARAGRKRQSLKREPNGRARGKSAQERIVHAVDKGSEHAQAMQALYGQDGCDAIGRAYRAGLLGEGNDAKALLDMARAISNAYWSAYEVGGFRSPIADKTHGGGGPVDHERVKRREIWLNESLSDVARMGPHIRRAFNQLVIDVNPDCGPMWLDQLIYAKRIGDPGDMADTNTLKAALFGLETLCGHRYIGARIVYVRDQRAA
jgi:hypothetical protein